MKRVLVSAAILSTLAGAAMGQSIATLPPNNGSGGVFLQLTPTAGPLTVNSFATYFAAAAGTAGSVEVWVRSGAYAGFTASNAGWTLSETVIGTSAGAAVLSSNIPLTNPIVIPAGGPTSIYLHCITLNNGLRYQGTGTTSTTTFVNADVTLFTDISRTGALPFGGTQFTPRAFSGTINYTLGGVTGACCFSSGPTNCTVTTQAGCTVQGGTYQGDGSDCSTANCPPLPTGACCKNNGTCDVLTQVACQAIAGAVYSGDNVTCAAANCPPGGACCFAAGTCQTLTQAACTTAGGTYSGDNVACAAANCPQPPQGPTGVYAVNIREGNVMVNFPIAAPAYTPVGTVASSLFALDFNGDGSKLYCITNPGNQLGVIAQTTGTLGIVAPISGAGAAEANWGGLAFDASTGTMYALAGSNLYTVNLDTGVTTLVAPITGAGAPLWIDIAINNAGTLLIGHDIASDSMYSINKATGVATLLGPTGVLANFAQGMDFDPDSGNLYATIYVGGGVGGFYQVDTTTGLCTLITNTQPWTAAGPEFEMAIKGAAPVACYANCDGSTGNPLLTANDFQCFLNKYAANDTYANCDGSTGNPLLTANDFQCFLNKYAAGCS